MWTASWDQAQLTTRAPCHRTSTFRRWAFSSLQQGRRVPQGVPPRDYTDGDALSITRWIRQYIKEKGHHAGCLL
jgi:hypothetical protein